MPFRSFRRGLGVLAALAALGAGTSAFAESGHRQRYVRVVEQDASGATILVQVPREALILGTNDDGYRTVGIQGLPTQGDPERPSLPSLVVSLGVPDEARLRLEVSAGPELGLPGPPLPPDAPAATVLDVPRDGPAWPDAAVSLQDVRFRSLRIARLQVRPILYDPRAQELAFVSDLRIRVWFDGSRHFSPPRGGTLGEVEEGVVRRVLANGATVLAQRREAAPAGPPAKSATPPSATSATPAVKIRVDRAGLVRVSQPDLVDAGLDAALVDPTLLELSYRGEPIPCLVRGEEDGSFDPSDTVEFYGIPGQGRYSAENVYWLEQKASPGLRFPEAAPAGAPSATPTSFQHTERYEEGNTIYTAGKPAQEGEPRFFWIWFEDNPLIERVTTFSHTVELIDLDVSGSTGRLRASFLGRTDPDGDPDHCVEFFVNGTSVGDSCWSGQTFHRPEVAFDAALLLPGSNEVRIDYVETALFDTYFMDWFEIEYPRLTRADGDRLTLSADPSATVEYQVQGLGGVSRLVVLDVTEPHAPASVPGVTVGGTGPYSATFVAEAGRRYVVAGNTGWIWPDGLTLDLPSDLRDPAHGADLLIVVPDGWESALAPLVAHREAQGLRVVLANLTDVADEFAGGNVDDVAIRDLVGYAYHNWQAPTLSYLLLVGEPNRDPQNHLGRTRFNHDMPIHFGVTESFGETSTDTWFGAVDGDDLLPDVGVGRFSVRSAEEAAALVAKIIAYETGWPTGEAWPATVLQIASLGGSFEQSLEAAATFLPGHFTVSRQYRGAGASSSSIAAAFDAGALVASFLGHGNIDFWADSPGTLFFTNTEVQALANAGRLPFVTAMNCLNGLIAYPTMADSMAEAFHNDPDNGALAVWAPSSLGFLSEYDALQKNLYETLFDRHVPYLGAATAASLVETFVTSPVDLDLVKQMVLLGDPSGHLLIDADDDGLLDHDELLAGLDAADRDSDDDGLNDGLEPEFATDSDGDGVPNGLDPDSDNDGLPDGLEAGVAAPGPDTNVALGRFRADVDPQTTTHVLLQDTDGGGAPDGAEDLDADGALADGESDPLVGADDPACGAAAVPEIAAAAEGRLKLDKVAGDILLGWGDERDAFPCILYRVYAAEGLASSAGASGFSLLGVTAQPALLRRTAASGGVDERYLVVGATPSAGEGSWGHFSR